MKRICYIYLINQNHLEMMYYAELGLYKHQP